MREDNKYRTLVSRVFLKIHSPEQPRDNHVRLV